MTSDNEDTERKRVARSEEISLPRVPHREPPPPTRTVQELQKDLEWAERLIGQLMVSRQRYFITGVKEACHRIRNGYSVEEILFDLVEVKTK